MRAGKMLRALRVLRTLRLLRLAKLRQLLHLGKATKTHQRSRKTLPCLGMNLQPCLLELDLARGQGQKASKSGFASPTVLSLPQIDRKRAVK